MTVLDVTGATDCPPATSRVSETYHTCSLSVSWRFTGGLHGEAPLGLSEGCHSLDEAAHSCFYGRLVSDDI